MRPMRATAPAPRPRGLWSLVGAAAGLAIATLIAGRIWPTPPPVARVAGEAAARACLGPDGHLPTLVAEVRARQGAIRPVATRLAPEDGEWTATMRYRTAAGDAAATARLDPHACTTILLE